MFHRIAFILLFCLSLAVVGVCNAQYWKGIVEKHGPIPEAILEPELGYEEEYRQQYTLSEQIMTMLGRRKRARKGSRVKDCIANQRVILGAIEMYNMDTNPMYKTLSPADLVDPEGPLFKGGYLKSAIINADDKRALRSYGNLYEEGLIYCEYHGTTIANRDELRALIGYKPKAASGEYRGLLIIMAVILCSALFLLAFKIFSSPKNAIRNDHKI